VERTTVPIGPGDGWDWSALDQLVSGITHRLLHNQSDAEDAAQEAMLRAYRAMRAGTVPDDLRAWIATIAKREAYRVHGRLRPAATLDESSAQQTNPEPDPAPVTLDRVAASQLLAGLDLETRELLVRRFALEQSSFEIGAAMKMQPSTVRVRLHRSLGHLRHSHDSV
jgi:RNA polymerase sigma-70 factor (ECF subfamily)